MQSFTPLKSLARHYTLLSKTGSAPLQEWIAVQLTHKMHTMSLSRNLKFISADKLYKEKGEMKVQVDGNPHRPLVLLYPWMLAKEKHAMKFAKLYLELGADVLRVKLSPMDLLRPTKGSQVVAQHVLDFIEINDKFDPLMIHGFSVGAYAFCESMVKANANPEKYTPLRERFVGQIWDSAMDIDGIPEGLSKAITKNKVLQKSLEGYLRWYLKVNHESATRHYLKSSEMMHTNHINVPGLFFYSKADPVSPPKMSEKAFSKWQQVYTKCFDASGHVSHYHKYRKEYEAEMFDFLEKIGMLNQRKQALKI